MYIVQVHMGDDYSSVKVVKSYKDACVVICSKINDNFSWLINPDEKHWQDYIDAINDNNVSKAFKYLKTFNTGYFSYSIKKVKVEKDIQMTALDITPIVTYEDYVYKSWEDCHAVPFLGLKPKKGIDYSKIKPLSEWNVNITLFENGDFRLNDYDFTFEKNSTSLLISDYEYQFMFKAIFKSGAYERKVKFSKEIWQWLTEHCYVV